MKRRIPIVITSPIILASREKIVSIDDKAAK
jgi:hypothetical protein